MKNYGLSMRNHSLKTNEIIAYTLFTGSCFSLLTLPGNMNCLFIIFISSIPGLLIVKSWLCRLPFFPCAFLSSLIACYGGYLCVYWQGGFPLSYAGAVLIGLFAGGMGLILPAQTTIALKSKIVFPLAFVWSFSIFTAVAARFLFRNHLHLLSAALFTVMLISLFLIKESMISDSYSPAAGKTASPADKKTKKKILSIDLFAMFSGASAAAIVPSVREIISGVKEAAFSVQDTVFPIRETVFPLISPLPLALLVFGFISGPVISAFFVERKGVFNATLFGIFITETCVLCFSLYNRSFVLAYLGCLLFGTSLSFPLAVCPLMSYYLFGPESCIKKTADMLIFLLVGYLAAFPVGIAAKPVFSSSLVLFQTILLLLSSFFAVFSAWKHRLILLQSQ